MQERGEIMEGRKKYLMCSFVNYTIYNILLLWSSKGECDRRGIKLMWGDKKCTQSFCPKTKKEEPLRIPGRRWEEILK
jgi:hypothetical protein